MTEQLTAANFIRNKENEVLNAKLVAWQASDDEIRFWIVKDRENSGIFVCTACRFSNNITDKTQIKKHLGMPKHMSYKIKGTYQVYKTVNFLCTSMNLLSLCKGRSR